MKIIIIGAGEVGYHIAQRLAAESKEVLLVDSCAEKLAEAAEFVDVQTLEGSGSNPEVLAQAGIATADILLAVTDSDEINIVACTFAAAMAQELITLARIRKDEYITFNEGKSLQMLNIDKAINPDVEIVRAIERLLSFPDVEEINEFAEGKIRLVGYDIQDNAVIGTRLTQMREIMEGRDIIIAAIIRNDDLIIPSGEDTIAKGDLLYFVCRQDDIRFVLERLGSDCRPARNILLIGGGDIGFRTAKCLEKLDVHVKLIERDPEVLEQLADSLRKTLVLRGDGTDTKLLSEENIGEMDLVITLTGDEESNILCALLAKSLGAKNTITRIDKQAYFSLVRAVGIENTVSPRMSAVNSILAYMRGGRVVSASSIKGDQGEVLEAFVETGSAMAGKRVMDLGLPRGTLLLALEREQQILFPSGATTVEPGDRVLLITLRGNIARLEQELAMNLEQL